MTYLTKFLIITWIKICAAYWGVQPEFALAVAHIESRIPGKQELRVGRLGRSKYYGPFGVHQCFLRKWPIDHWPVNCWYGIRALRGPNKITVLKRYNVTFDQAYWSAIKRAERKYDEEKTG